MLNLNLTQSGIVTTEYETELKFIHESTTLYTATAGKKTKESKNSIGNNNELFQVTPEIAYGHKGHLAGWNTLPKL